MVFCHHGRFVATDVLTLDVLTLRMLCDGRFVTGRFVTGRFVGESLLKVKKLLKNFNLRRLMTIPSLENYTTFRIF